MTTAPTSTLDREQPFPELPFGEERDLDGKISRQNGHAIRALRQREGISVVDLAAICGASASHMRNIELEHRDASPEQLAKVADALNVPVAALTRLPASQRPPRTRSAKRAS